MKTWLVSSLDEESIQGEETIQGRKLYEEIRYVKSAKKYFGLAYSPTYPADLSLSYEVILI